MHILFLAKTSPENQRLIQALCQGGFVVDLDSQLPTRSVEGAVFRYELLVLDIASIGNEGVETIRRIRALSHQVSILVLSESNVLETKLLYFELGIDDFVVKPVPEVEFMARVRASLRRLNVAQQDTLAISKLRLDRLSRRVFWGDREITLARKEFLLLEYLMLHAEAVVSRETIMRDLWKTPYDGNGNVIDVYIRQLRKKIEEPHGQKLIHTIRGDGYAIREVRKESPDLAPALKS